MPDTQVLKHHSFKIITDLLLVITVFNVTLKDSEIKIVRFEHQFTDKIRAFFLFRDEGI